MRSDETKIPVNGANHHGDVNKQNTSDLNMRYTKKCQESSRVITIRQFIKSLLVWLACWEMLPAALTVLLMEGLRHD